MACLATFADVAQWVERGHAMAEATSSRLVICSTSGVSMHSEATSQGVGGPGCARSLARPRAARHHVRRDARAWAQPKWNLSPVAQQAEQPPCKRQVAGSNPVTSTTNQRLVNSAARVPARLAGSRGFDSRTGRQHHPLVAEMADAPVSETGAHAGMSVRLGPRGPHTSPVAQRKSGALMRRRSVDRPNPGRLHPSTTRGGVP